MSRRTVLLAAAVALLVTGVALLVGRLTRTPPTDEELIRALFDDAAKAAEEKRVSDAVAAVSERFASSGAGYRRPASWLTPPSGLSRSAVPDVIRRAARPQQTCVEITEVAHQLEELTRRTL